MALLAAVMLIASACGSDNGDASDTDASDAGDTGSETASEGAPTDADIQALTATLVGAGASFPDAFYQAVNADFNGIAGSEIITYGKSGSSDGRRQLAAGTADLAGTDSLPKDGEFETAPLFFPTVAAPIAIGFNVEGLESLRLTPALIASIFQGEITTWNDEAIAAENDGVELPSTTITIVRRSDGSGTTSNFTKYIEAAAGDAWSLGSGDEVNWPTASQGAEGNAGVAGLMDQTNGSIGYVDLADALKAGLAIAEVQNAAGNFVLPSTDGVQDALASADINDDLTYNPLNAPGDNAYPITAPTWIIVVAEQSNADVAESLRTYLRYMLTTGQDQASPNAYTALPEVLRERAFAQIDQIVG